MAGDVFSQAVAQVTEPAVPLFRARMIGLGFEPDRGLVLIELRAESAGPACVVIGMGLNAALGAPLLEQIAAMGLAPIDLASAGLKGAQRNAVAAGFDYSGIGRCTRARAGPRHKRAGERRLTRAAAGSPRWPLKTIVTTRPRSGSAKRAIISLKTIIDLYSATARAAHAGSSRSPSRW